MFSQFIIPFSALFCVSYAASTFSPARPPAIPLAVKSPYLQCWQQAGSDAEAGGPGNGGYLAGQWPTFWAGQILGWTGMIRVDNTSYTWMGSPNPLPTVVTQTSFEYTSTRSTFVMDVAGLVEMNITFLSPITPTDLKRQSLVFSYLDVSVTSTDGAAHDVQLYADITAEWASADKTAVAEWEYGVTSDDSSTTTAKRSISESLEAPLDRRQKSNAPSLTLVGLPGGIAYHKVYRQTQLLWSETADQTDYGSWYWATDNVAGLTFQSGADTDVRSAFTTSGVLANTNDTNFRAIGDDYPTFGFAVDLGSVETTAVSTLFSLGLTQEQAIQFDGATGDVSVPSLWTSYFSNELDAVGQVVHSGRNGTDFKLKLAFFHTDYATASGLATSFDNQVSDDGMAAGGADFVTIASLTVRQAFGGTQLCGTTDTPYLFLKEISSDGNAQTVDVIFPFHPILLYSNPALLRYLLDPLFINQEAGQYPNMYSMHDLGSRYPNATGHMDGKDEPQPLEECGNMLIMTLAYAQRANDTAYLSQHYALLDQWTQYLIEEAMIPADQISTDDFAGALANQTNLALKGIIGIEAMAVIANLTGNTTTGANYTSIAHDYITDWQNLGIARDADPPHTTLSYGMNDTHGLLYNLFGDRELGLNLVPQYVYDMQSAFYPTIEEQYGVALDTRHDYAKTDEQMLAAAIASTNTSRMFFSDIATWINETPTNRALTDLYNATGGDYGQDPGLTFTARPTVGGAFALLLLTK